MCKVQRYRYICGHGISYRLSSCRGTFKKPSRAGYNIPACQLEPYISLRSTSACGRCQNDEFNAHWTSRIEQARSAHNETQQKLACSSGYSNGVGASNQTDSEDGFARLKILAEEVENLSTEFEAASWQIRQRFPPYERDPYTPPAHNPQSSSPSPLREEVSPDELVTEERQQWALESENDQLRFTSYTMFQSFFMDKYGLWGPEIYLPTVIAEAESNRSGNPELELRSLALVYGPDVPEGDADPSLEDSKVQNGRSEDGTLTSALAQGITFLAPDPDTPILDDDSGSVNSKNTSEATHQSVVLDSC